MEEGACGESFEVCAGCDIFEGGVSKIEGNCSEIPDCSELNDCGLSHSLPFYIHCSRLFLGEALLTFKHICLDELFSFFYAC